MDVTMIAEKELLTGEAYYELTDIGRSELVEGVIVPMSRTGAEHGYIEWESAFLLSEFIRNRELGWIVDPQIQMVWRYRSPRDVELLEGSDILRGEGLLEGFDVNLAELFAD